MVGTLEGGRKARDTNYKNHGKDFYKRIGAKGGRNGHTGGFAADPERAKWAGAKGGSKSRRGNSNLGYSARVRENLGVIYSLVDSGWSLVEVAQFLKVPYGSLQAVLRRERLK